MPTRAESKIIAAIETAIMDTEEDLGLMGDNDDLDHFSEIATEFLLAVKTTYGAELT